MSNTTVQTYPAFLQYHQVHVFIQRHLKRPIFIMDTDQFQYVALFSRHYPVQTSQKLQRELTYGHGTGRFLYVTNVESSASFDIGK